MRKIPAEKDYFSKPTFGASNLTNLNTRMFDKSR